MNILVGYGIGPRTERVICLYWGHLRMVARAGPYYGGPFQGLRKVAQGQPLSPIIFNMVVCVFWYLYCVACPNYDVERVVQPRFQPHTATNPVVDLG